MYLLKTKSPELQQEKDLEISKPEKDLEERVCGSAEMAMWQGDKNTAGAPGDSTTVVREHQPLRFCTALQMTLLLSSRQNRASHK